MKHTVSRLLLTSALTLGFTGPAVALNFTFSFEGDNNNPGTVQGRILGLSEGTSAATGVFVDSATPTPFLSSLTTNFVDFVPDINSFDVTNGQITAASFSAQNSNKGLRLT